jgi:acetyl-CoA synthetase
VVLQRRRRRRCPIVDTWWQTETGGILITPLPGATI